MPQPLNIFTARHDLPAIARALRSLDPSAVMNGDENTWTQIVLQGSDCSLAFSHCDAADKPDWARQLSAMTNFFDCISTPAADAKRRATELARTCRLWIGVMAEPRVDADSRFWPAVSAVAKQVDGLIFNGKGLYEPSGLLVLDTAGNSQAGAAPTATPPDARRVARRAMVLAAVAFSSFLEQDPDANRAAGVKTRMQQWFNATHLSDELEPAERQVVMAAPRTLPKQTIVDSGWRAEAVAVMAWALGRHELPEIGSRVHPKRIFDSIGFLNPAAAAMIDASNLRGADQIRRVRATVAAIHWRLHRFIHVNQDRIDLPAALAATPELQGMSLDGVKLIDNDLAVGSSAITAAPADYVHFFLSTTMERHRAANWMLGGSEFYSQTPTPT